MMSNANQLSRRGLILSSLLGGTALLAGSSRWGTGQARGDSPSRPLRFIHLTDTHIHDDRAAIEGFTAALESVARLSPAPEFIITGGDHVNEGSDAELARVNRQWDLYDQLIEPLRRRHAFYPVIGNHDVLNWDLPRSSGASGSPGTHFGKHMAMDRLGLVSPFYSFDRGGWHFICLDNIARRGSGYYGALDLAQLEWLKADLRQVGTTRPICVISHIPLLAACVFFDPSTKLGNGTYGVNDSDMHHDISGLLQVLKPEGRPYNVRLAISGHIHLRDRVEYNGTTFICGGAVSGNWWQQPWQGYRPGYGVFDLWPDGTFKHEHVTYVL